MNTDRDIKRRLGTTLGLTAFVIVGAAIASSIGEDREYSATHDPDLYPSSGEIYPSKNEISVEQLSKKELSRKQLEEEGYDCAIIPEGSHLTQELRVRGAPGIDPGPYGIVHEDGDIQRFGTYSDLPSLVFPKEYFCIKKVEPQSSSINPKEPHGVIFDGHNKQQNEEFNKKSRKIQASIRTRNWF